MKLLVVLLIAVFSAGRAWAQSAPEGNAHPTPERGGGAPVPAFGDPAASCPGEPRKRRPAQGGLRQSGGRGGPYARSR
jgi:hypothetical protein